VARYAAALRAAVRGIGPIRFTITGLTLTPISVMARARPAGPAADDLADAFGAALGPDGRYRDRPDIWYVNLAYFTGPVRDPQGLIDWIAARRERKVTDVLVTDIQIVRWCYTSTGMMPVVLASATRPSMKR
jgi:predicted RecB family endonuclease